MEHLEAACIGLHVYIHIWVCRLICDCLCSAFKKPHTFTKCAGKYTHAHMKLDSDTQMCKHTCVTYSLLSLKVALFSVLCNYLNLLLQTGAVGGNGLGIKEHQPGQFVHHVSPEVGLPTAF